MTSESCKYVRRYRYISLDYFRHILSMIFSKSRNVVDLNIFMSKWIYEMYRLIPECLSTIRLNFSCFTHMHSQYIFYEFINLMNWDINIRDEYFINSYCSWIFIWQFINLMNYNINILHEFINLSVCFDIFILMSHWGDYDIYNYSSRINQNEILWLTYYYVCKTFIHLYHSLTCKCVNVTHRNRNVHLKIHIYERYLLLTSNSNFHFLRSFSRVIMSSASSWTVKFNSKGNAL